MYLVFTHMPGESYCRRLRSLLLYLCYTVWATPLCADSVYLCVWKVCTRALNNEHAKRMVCASALSFYFAKQFALYDSYPLSLLLLHQLTCIKGQNMEWLGGGGGGGAQLVEHWMEKLSTTLTQVWFPSVAMHFSPTGNFQCRLSYSVQSPCVVTCINICAHVKSPQHWQPYQCPNTNKILHTLVEMGSIALAAAVAIAR